MDKARGELCDDGEGDVTGDGASTVLFWPPNKLRTFSSSDGVLISTSFSSDERNDGCSCGSGGSDGGGGGGGGGDLAAAVPFTSARLDCAGEVMAVEDSP